MAKQATNQRASAAKQPPRRGEPRQEVQQTKKQIAHGKKLARQNRIIFLAVGALALIMVVILGVGLFREVLPKANAPVAIVDGTKIGAKDYDALAAYLRFNLNYYIQQIQTQLQGLDTTDQNNQFILSYYQQQLNQLQTEVANVDSTSLDELIDAELIREKAKELGAAVTKTEVNDELQQFLSPAPQATATTTETVPTPTPIPQSQLDANYNSFLQNVGITDQQFRAIIERNLLRTKVQDVLASQVPTTGLIVHVQMIVTNTNEIATAAEQRIQNGEDFATVAKEVSSDPQVDQNGGDVGWLAQGQTSRRYGQALEDWIFAQQPGALGVVESNGQFYVVKVLERNENGPLPAEELTYRQDNALTDWLAQRRASPDVKIERLLVFTPTPGPTSVPATPTAAP